MIAQYQFTLPWPPSVNAWKTPYQGKMILTAKGREYRKAVLNHCYLLGLANALITGPVRIELVLNPPTRRRYDVDNFTKSPFDALTHAGFWADDEQVVDLHIKKGAVTKGGSIELTVFVYEDQPEVTL